MPNYNLRSRGIVSEDQENDSAAAAAAPEQDLAQNNESESNDDGSEDEGSGVESNSETILGSPVSVDSEPRLANAAIIEALANGLLHDEFDWPLRRNMLLSTASTISNDNNDFPDVSDVNTQSETQSEDSWWPTERFAGDNGTNSSESVSIRSSPLLDSPQVESSQDNNPHVNNSQPNSPNEFESPPKKRKRMNGPKSTPVASTAQKGDDDEDEDDGLTCPICLEHWEVSGPHRLVALRCGHLFGDSCIRRWLNESVRISGSKVCPQCKTKASTRDVRQLYGRRVRAIDRSEEHRLREELVQIKHASEKDREKIVSLTSSNGHLLERIRRLQVENEQLILGQGSLHTTVNDACQYISPRYRLALDKTIMLTTNPGSRVLIYSAQHQRVFASQQSTPALFPGYGVRLLDARSGNPVSFCLMTTKMIRDIALSENEQELIAVSQEPICKLFDLRTYSMGPQFSAEDSPLWSCARGDESRNQLLYLGTQNGAIKAFDVRIPQNVVQEFISVGRAPVISIAVVPASKTFPHGGVLVAKLTSVYFYEYTNQSNETIPTPLQTEGPFVSMSYDRSTGMILLLTRCTERHKLSRFICGKLVKIDDTPSLQVLTTFLGSTQTKVMTRAAQFSLDNTTLVLGYLQDRQQLVTYDLARKERTQTLPISSIVYDVCGIKNKNNNVIAALTDTKCRFYNVHSTD